MVNRGKADRHVVEELRIDTADGKGHYRSERRIASGTDEHVDSCWCHGFQEEARRPDRLQVGERDLELLQRRDAHVDTADLGLVEDLGVEDLEHRGPRERVERVANRSRRIADLALRNGDPGVGQELLRLRLVERNSVWCDALIKGGDGSGRVHEGAGVVDERTQPDSRRKRRVVRRYADRGEAALHGHHIGGRAADHGEDRHRSAAERFQDLGEIDRARLDQCIDGNDVDHRIVAHGADDVTKGCTPGGRCRPGSAGTSGAEAGPRARRSSAP